MTSLGVSPSSAASPWAFPGSSLNMIDALGPLLELSSSACCAGALGGDGGERRAWIASSSGPPALVGPGWATGGSEERAGAVGVVLCAVWGSLEFFFFLRPAELSGRATAGREGTRGEGIDPALRLRPMPSRGVGAQTEIHASVAPQCK